MVQTALSAQHTALEENTEFSKGPRKGFSALTLLTFWAQSFLGTALRAIGCSVAFMVSAH